MPKIRDRRKCLMGCPDGPLHIVPTNPKRRKNWLRILGKETSAKKPFLCSRHFSEGCFYGKKLSKYAIPNEECGRPNAPDLNENSVISSSSFAVNSTPASTSFQDINLQSADIVENKDVQTIEVCIDDQNNINLTEENQFNLSEEDTENLNIESKNNLEIYTNDLDIGERNARSGNFTTTFSKHTINSKISTLQTSLDHYRNQYLKERKQKSELKSVNVKLSKELDRHKAKIKILEAKLTSLSQYDVYYSD